MPIWLQLLLVVGLAVMSWISGMDVTGNPIESSLLWAATLLAGGHLVLRLLLGAR